LKRIPDFMHFDQQTPFAARIQAFGMLADLVGDLVMDMRDIPDTDTLRARLTDRIPALQQASFVIAVNRQVAGTNTAIAHGAEIALLPPFSGG